MRKVVIALSLACVLLAALMCLPVRAIDYPESYTPYYNETHAIALAKLLWAEARGVPSDTEKAAVVWCVINRVEAGYGNVMEVLTAPNQFAYYIRSPVDAHLYALAVDVLIRWDMERCGYEEVGRVLPLQYLWFNGYAGRNWFRPAYNSSVRWDWSLPTPYAS